jgi:alpha-galactosidase
MSLGLALAPSPAWSDDNRSAAAQTVWLDSLDLSTMEQGWGEARANLSVTKARLSIGGRPFERGVGTHAPSSYRLDLAGGTERFEATVGLDDDARGRGSVVFQLFADGKKIFDSGLLRGKSPAQNVSVDLHGVKELLLSVTDAGDGLQNDHADWAAARFTVTGIQPAPANSGLVDPLAALPLPGRSSQRLAKAVRLPLERTLPGPISDWALLLVNGQGSKEYYLRFQELGSEGYRHAQRRGRASNGMKPMWVLANRRTGQGLALMLAYMGNWTFEVAPKGQQVCVRLATSPAELKPFEKLHGLPVPGALVAEFSGHWDYGTQPMVRFIREKLLRELGPAWPPVQYNTWYDLYDQITYQRLVDAAKVAKSVGCELFTIDAGWFGEGLDAKWSQTLGDWRVNHARLPQGLSAVSAAVHQLGMKFGLWFEIECAAPTSELAKSHPDWFLTAPQGTQLSKRGMLDFGKPEVLAHAKQVLDDAVQNYSLDYIKMDFNTDPAIENEGLTQANDPLYRHYRGMAELWSHLRAKHPNLVVEDCSSGARRHELTSAALTDTHWISDTIDNKANLLIMLGATYFFPATTCSHWSTQPEPTNSVLDLDAQFVVNMMGHLGLSGAIASWDAPTLAIVRERIAQYKRLRPLLGKADVFHLTTPRLGALQAALYAEPDSGRALLFAFQGGAAALTHTLPLRGLEPSRRYRLSVPVGHQGMVTQTEPVAGRELIERGLTITFPHPGAAALVELEPVR